MLKKFIIVVVAALALFTGAFVAGCNHVTAIAPVHPPKMQLVSFSSCSFGATAIVRLDRGEVVEVPWQRLVAEPKR